jgi:hypothetical protein
MSRLKQIAKLAVIIVLVSIISVPVSAISEAQRDFFAKNKILFYDPDGVEEYDSCEEASAPTGKETTVIGDSITAASEFTIKSKLSDAEIDAKTGRNFATAGMDGDPGGVEIAKKLELRKYVVFALGTNSASLTKEQVKSAVDAIGNDKRIIFVTNYHATDAAKYAGNNQIINDAPKDYANVSVADWADAVGKDPSKYIDDSDGLGVHPTSDGKKLFADVIYSALQYSSNGAQGAGAGSNRDYTGNEMFSEAELSALKANQPFYEAAAGEAGIPWQVMAVIHYRETRFQRKNPSNGQGVYQHLTGDGGPYPEGAVDDAEFQRQTTFTAKKIKNSYSAGKDLSVPENVKYTFFRYNGRAQVYVEQALNLGFSQAEAENGEGSPYVMNRFDARRDPTAEPTKSNRTWGQIKSDGGPIEYPANSDYGAYTYYAAIAGLSSGCANLGGDINAMALKLSWEPGNSNVGTFNPKPEYIEAMVVAKLNVGNNCATMHNGNSDGASCDMFVATVYRNTVDPDFPCCGTNTMLRAMQTDQKLKDKYQEIAANGDYSKLQPGDIMLADGHVMIYVQLADGTFKIASASCGNRTADHDGNPAHYANGGEFFDNYGTGGAKRVYYIFRWKGGAQSAY